MAPYKSSWCLIVCDMIPSAFFAAVVFLWCSFVVRCNVPSPCDATVKCANNMTVCEKGSCQIQAGQVCTIETTTTVVTTAQTITTTGSTQTRTTSQTPSATEALSTTSAPTITSALTTTTATTNTAPPITTPLNGKRRKRYTGQQECVSNASCVSGQQTNKTLVCACNDGYTADNRKCNKDSGNGAGPLRVTEFCTVLVTTVLLLLI
ncbi:hypothetical protein DPMN_122030 [Dreissena polymorpha]|uniref:EGF-like domain-containing protein n=1 Tax=Dreissena polymorpha TaxID=45954 RepID=A0A9D4GN87_DREPO|nr:hypothetical protein DPMN_122030 [Dreissena polymorpha]